MRFAPRVTAAALVLLLFLCSLAGLLQRARHRALDESQVTIVNLSMLASACKEFRRAVGRWPTQLSEVNLAISRSTNFVKDGWGREIKLYWQSNAPQTIWLQSYGADGNLGGTGSNADTMTQLK